MRGAAGAGEILGVDDGYFPHSFKPLRGFSPVVGVLGRGPRILGISVKLLLVDSREAPRVLKEIYSEISARGRPRAIVTDNVIFGGFSVYDPWELGYEVGLPVIAVFSHPLDLERIRAALERHFEDHRERYGVIERSYRSSVPVPTPRGMIRILCAGAGSRECLGLVVANQTYHPMPQPLRHADVIASALGRILSPPGPRPGRGEDQEVG